MNGATVANSAFLPTIADTNWDISGVGDFSGDELVARGSWLVARGWSACSFVSACPISEPRAPSPEPRRMFSYSALVRIKTAATAPAACHHSSARSFSTNVPRHNRIPAAKRNCQ